MKDINEVLRKKESDLQQLQREVEALRVAARLLSEEAETSSAYGTRLTAGAGSYVPSARPAAPAATEPSYGSWDAAGVKKFP